MASKQRKDNRNRGGGKRSKRFSPKRLFNSASFATGPRDIVVPRMMLILSVFALTILGIIMVFSSSSIEALDKEVAITSYMTSQLVYAIIAIVGCFFVAYLIPYYRWFGRMLDIFWIISLILLILTAAIGTATLGAQRWLVVGPIHFQPSEFAKPAFILCMARIMYQFRTENIKLDQLGIRLTLYVVAPLLLLYIAQSDLGTTLICIVGLLAVAWLADVPARPFLIAMGVIFVLGLIAVFGVGYRSDRMIFLDPESDYFGNGYQLARSFYAFGEGGVFGVGLGNSTEKYLYLPEIETDFIFAIVGEELGLIGTLFVVALFLVILYAGIQIARKAPDMFGGMVAGGCTAMLVFQAFLNICCVIGLAPTTGKPLPFLSSGGSALIGSYLLVGIILSVSLASTGDSSVYRVRREDFEVVSRGRSRSIRSATGRPSINNRNDRRQRR